MTVPSAFADKWLLWRLESFQKQHPYYDLRIDTSSHLLNDSAAALQTAISGNGVALGRTTLVERDLAWGAARAAVQ
ncbi:hypothetical protein [Paraburkholderia bengalensis]|uniref:hypothetical protein n=1 Tax=Paraburkholderia bengalensis TaxID=2747562 RepID=UPI0030155DEE